MTSHPPVSLCPQEAAAGFPALQMAKPRKSRRAPGTLYAPPWGQALPPLEATLHLQGRGFWGQTEWRPLSLSQSLNKHPGPQTPGEGNAEDRAE